MPKLAGLYFSSPGLFGNNISMDNNFVVTINIYTLIVIWRD